MKITVYSYLHLVLQFLLALLAGVGAFTVLHVLGFGLIYKVQPFRAPPDGTVNGGTLGTVTDSKITLPAWNVFV